MKCAMRCSVMSLGVLSIAAIATLPAVAQFVAIPVSNGSFALQGTGGGTTYVNPAAPMTLLSPAGTLNITSAPLPDAAVSPTITTNTPVGMYFYGVSGNANLNDGRTANFSSNGYLKLQSLGTVSGAASSPMLPTAAGVLVNYAVQSGSLAIPQTSISAYPASTVSIPISSGSFTINVPTNGQAGTVTINSLLTPQGTTNLTLTLPDLGTAPTGDLSLNAGGQAILMHAIANGSVILNNGNVATVNNRLVTLTGTASLTSGAEFWYGEQVPAIASTVQVTITGGSINVPQSAIGAAPPPAEPVQPTQPIQPIQPIQPAQPIQSPQSTQPTQPPPSNSEVNGVVSAVIQSNSVITEALTTRPTPTATVSPRSTVSLNFATNVSFVDQPANLLQQLAPTAEPQEISEVEGSPLNVSRIHPGLHADF